MLFLYTTGRRNRRVIRRVNNGITAGRYCRLVGATDALIGLIKLLLDGINSPAEYLYASVNEM